MAGHVLELRGSTPEPLGNYLKGLGVFRLIAEQADPQVRAWWKDGALWLYTRWSKDEVSRFFLHGVGDEKKPIYSPTPIFAPWGGMPPFFETSDKIPKERLQKLLRQEHIRFEQSQKVVKNTISLLKSRDWISLSKNQRKKAKNEIVVACRSVWLSTSLDWYDAAISMEQEPRFGFLFGTGGNEGRADITNNFWELIEETIGLPTPRADTRELLVASIFGGSRVGGSRRRESHEPIGISCPHHLDLTRI